MPWATPFMVTVGGNNPANISVYSDGSVNVFSIIPHISLRKMISVLINGCVLPKRDLSWTYIQEWNLGSISGALQETKTQICAWGNLVLGRNWELMWRVWRWMTNSAGIGRKVSVTLLIEAWVISSVGKAGGCYCQALGDKAKGRDNASSIAASSFVQN